ncbi:MAG TPA: endonuclease [Rhodospirillaceae bacterium]|nr:MAG: endonuclease [Alphaproteobacteria bacterium GWF2_58_20]HAU29293.1 endonuclease [Rhodospirillaceae bacterium]
MTGAFRIATFNLENLDEPLSGNVPFADRLAILRSQLQRLRADIICFQEVNSQRITSGGGRELLALTHLLQGTPYEGWPMAAAGGVSGDEIADRHNLVIVSRWPFVARQVFRHALVPPPMVQVMTSEPAQAAPQAVEWDRPVLHVEFEIGGRQVHLINIHLRASLAAFIPGQKVGPVAWQRVSSWAEGFYLASIKRAGQALEVRFLIDRIFDADPEAFIIVAGDFNADDGEVPLRIVRGDEEDTRNGKLAGRMMVPIDRNVPQGQRFSVIHAGRAMMLDHILVSRPLLGWFRKAEIHNEALGDEVIAASEIEQSPESFHAPLVAEFEVQG